MRLMTLNYLTIEHAFQLYLVCSRIGGIGIYYLGNLVIVSGTTVIM